jgi:glycosyltransferase involved in cell wall biosynthesis
MSHPTSDGQPCQGAVADSLGGQRIDYALPAQFLLSVVVPVYNERETIGTVIGSLRQLPVPLEIVAVDDHSCDGTTALLRRLETQFPELQVVYKDQNEGKGAALRAGFGRARGDVVIVQDGDLEYDPRDIPRLLEPIVQGQADVVYGSRFLERKWAGSSALHRCGNRALTLISNITTGLKLTDMETCYKAFRREVLAQINLEQDGFGFEAEVTAKVARGGWRVVEVPISYAARGWRQGKKIGLRDALNALYCVVRYR